MRMIIVLLSVASVFAPLTGSAQHGGASPTLTVTAPREVSQYDFFVGDWDLDVVVPAQSFAAKIHGMPKLVGTWRVRKALDGWGIEDDLKITDAGGNPKSLSHAVRYYDRNARRWAISGLDIYRGRFSTSTATWTSKGMQSVGGGRDADGKNYQIRTLMYDITPASFRMKQERSADNGKHWSETIAIEGRRTGLSSQ